MVHDVPFDDFIQNGGVNTQKEASGKPLMFFGYANRRKRSSLQNGRNIFKHDANDTDEKILDL